MGRGTGAQNLASKDSLHQNRELLVSCAACPELLVSIFNEPLPLENPGKDRGSVKGCGAQGEGRWAGRECGPGCGRPPILASGKGIPAAGQLRALLLDSGG